MPTTDLIVTIDGPAGSGKSTVARLLAKRLGCDYLDTGGMYRAAALFGLQANLDMATPGVLAQALQGHKIEGRGERTFLDGRDVTDEIRSDSVTQNTHYSADDPDVRALMVDLQRATAQGRRIVTEGRDQGSVVFPHATNKFYLTASPECRAQRRIDEIKKKNNGLLPREFGTEEDILTKINQRDWRDSHRTVGPLCTPQDAMVIQTDNLSVEQVVEHLAKLVEDRRR
ncbi:MAG: (d)CMP kinase [Planctomycetia bacterium]|nr:(d)CMP kinase [Planctomycetia bacterium]